MIKAENIQKSFGQLQVLKGIDLKIEVGEMVAIVGKSGAGKTTLLQILGTLDKPSAGSVRYGDTDVFSLTNNELADFRNKKIGFVFQFHQLLPEFTAVENVMLPALIAGQSRREAESRAKELLSRFRLSERFLHKPSELSGGEKQRVAVARALMMKPEIIFADEPSGSLDSANKAELHQLLKQLNKETGQTIVIVTHDNELARLSDRIIQIKDGKIL